MYKVELRLTASGTGNSLAQGELVDRDAAAQLLGVSPRTLDRWHLLDEGPPRIRYGAQVRYRMASLEQWLLAKEVVGSRSFSSREQPKI